MKRREAVRQVLLLGNSGALVALLSISPHSSISLQPPHTVTSSPTVSPPHHHHKQVGVWILASCLSLHPPFCVIKPRELLAEHLNSDVCSHVMMHKHEAAAEQIQSLHHVQENGR